jgi:hypothetical protein
MCYVGWLGRIETSDSIFTGILRKLGAVFYGTVSIVLMTVKTAVPQSLMCGETINNVTGYSIIFTDLVVSRSIHTIINSLVVAPLAAKAL